MNVNTNNEPIVFVRQQGEVWQSAIVFFNIKGFCQDFPSRKSAEKAAEVWAKKNDVPYVAGPSFISIYNISMISSPQGAKSSLAPKYVACEVPLDDYTVKFRGVVYDEFEKAVTEARSIAQNELKPFAPHFYVERL